MFVAQSPESQIWIAQSDEGMDDCFPQWVKISLTFVDLEIRPVSLVCHFGVGSVIFYSRQSFSIMITM
jgi:hypothetical protein